MNNALSGKKKRGSSGYMLWLNANREMIKSDHLDYESLVGRDKVTEVAKKGGELWNLLDDSEKDEWKAKARDSRGDVSPKKARVKYSYNVKDMEGDVLVNGYEGPLVGQYLNGKTSVGVGRGKGTFSTLSEAVEASDKLEDCSGIVKGKGGYQLRVGRKLKVVTDEMWCDYVKVWIKSSIDLEEEKSKASTKKVAQILSTEKIESESETEETEEKSKETEEESKETEEDDDSEEEESEEEAEFDVEEWEFKGTTYYVDPTTDTVYDKNQDELGKRRKLKSGTYKLVLNKK
jgi:hypothetical protein